MPFVRGPNGKLVEGPDGRPLHSGSPPKAGKKRRRPKGAPIKYRTLRALPAPTGDREASPDKRVSFGRRLVRGPTPAYSRNRTPSRSALTHPHDEITTTDHIHRSEQAATQYPNHADGPSEQLRGEELQAISRRSISPEYHGESTDSDEFPMPVTSGLIVLNRSSTSMEHLDLKDIDDETQRDDEVCRRVHELRAYVLDTAQSLVYHNDGTFRKQHCLEDLCGDVRHAQLVRYIGCLAQGGPKREESWRELLTNPECRVALVVGIIGTALKEHVFSELWFGGTDEEIGALEALQEKQKHGEGYERTKQRAKVCNRYSKTFQISAAHKVTIALGKLLSPFYSMGQKHSQAIPEDLLYRLADIVNEAGDISRQMRRCGDVIYHWPPTFKDEEFDPDRMECMNIGDMISNSPFEKKIVDGYERSVLKEPTEDFEAIVRIVSFPGLVVHRQGGGALAQRLLQEEKEADDNQNARVPPDVQRARRMTEGDKLTGDEGFRTRVLCKSVVHLVWGRQRLLTREAGTSAHIDAMRDGKEKKYEDDRKGYIELYDYFLQKNPSASR